MAGPWGLLSTGLAAATTGVLDVDGGPLGGCYRQVRQRPPPELETSMVGPLGVAGGRFDSGHHRSWRRRWRAPGGCCRQVWQWPPPELDTSTAGPLGGAGGRSGSGHHRSWRHRWRAPWGVLAAGPAVATTKIEDVDGGLTRGADGRSGNGHHQVGDIDGGPPVGCLRQVR
jgi:hypothetical protein